VPITAEGVESEQIRNALADYGCSEAQGWLFGRAISAEAVRSFLASAERDAEPQSDKNVVRRRSNRSW
jgi:EAL domain-containing protein (putative c-di-GMP-specific phosphodiesterase class I)